jgi:hypothetical protein
VLLDRSRDQDGHRLVADTGRLIVIPADSEIRAPAPAAIAAIARYRSGSAPITARTCSGVGGTTSSAVGCRRSAGGTRS